MKKSVLKKLSLHKETLRALEEADLRTAAGGFSSAVPCQTGTRCNISLCICD